MTQPGEELQLRMTQEKASEALSVREQVLDVLLEKIRGDRYPSPTMMDDVESLLTPWRIEDYAQVLMEKVRDDRFPSHAMIKRLARLSG